MAARTIAFACGMLRQVHTSSRSGNMRQGLRLSLSALMAVCSQVAVETIPFACGTSKATKYCKLSLNMRMMSGRLLSVRTVKHSQVAVATKFPYGMLKQPNSSVPSSNRLTLKRQWRLLQNWRVMRPRMTQQMLRALFSVQMVGPSSVGVTTQPSACGTLRPEIKWMCLTDIHILSRASLSVQMVAQSQVEVSTAQSFCGNFQSEFLSTQFSLKS